MKKIDIKEFEILFREYYNDLCNFAAAYTKDDVNAEEIVQNVFYKIWEKRKTIKIKTSVKSYLFSAVRNNCLQEIKHQQIVRRHQEKVKQETNLSKKTPFSDLVYSETYEIFDNTLNSLPERCKNIFKMSRFEGLKYREIAEKMSISIKTVEANMSRALRKFRLSFKDYVYLIIMYLTIY